ncbi:MAG: WecB/TagA/CpsF family glycosyltransferase [Tyzzerella sp.]|nr:WecB/TagA/CpsF family glycosyltransferase [Tyzzerella sp.]
MNGKIQISDGNIENYTAKEAMKQVVDTMNSKAVQAIKVITSEGEENSEEQRLFVKMFVRFLHKNQGSVFLLAESEKRLSELQEYLENEHCGIQVVGTIALEEGGVSNDMILNHINGVETDCIIAALPKEIQEEFVASYRTALDAKIWLGIGTHLKMKQEKWGIEAIKQFFVRHLLKK